MRITAAEAAMNAYFEIRARRLRTFHKLAQMDTMPDGHGGYRFKHVGVAEAPGDYEHVPTGDACRRPFHEHDSTSAIKGHGVIAPSWADAMTVGIVLERRLGGHPLMLDFLAWLYPKEGLHAENPDRRPEDWPPLRAKTPGPGLEWARGQCKDGEMVGRCVRRVHREVLRAVSEALRDVAESPRTHTQEAI